LPTQAGKQERHSRFQRCRLHGAKVIKKVEISVRLQHFLMPGKSLTVISTLYLFDFQTLTKKLQEHIEKKA